MRDKPFRGITQKTKDFLTNFEKDEIFYFFCHLRCELRRYAIKHWVLFELVSSYVKHTFLLRIIIQND